MALRAVDQEENKRRMRNGQLYFCFTPDLIAERRRCRQAFEQFNSTAEVDRRTVLELFLKIVDDKTPLPPQAATPEEDEDLLADYVWCDRPVKMDYGYNVNHPTDPRVRNGLNGPEDGAPITIGEDCWFGGNVTVLAGVTIGRGCTIGAGSVVTRDIPPFMVAAGNPARVIRPIRQVPAEELPPGYIPPADIPYDSSNMIDRDPSKPKGPDAYMEPTTLPATRASTPATTAYTIGTATRYFHLVRGLPTCINRAMAVALRWNAVKRIRVQIRVNRHES
ncbi:hypothetical protein CHU98_g12522 [Xylaria longipes]|nr:hypothetical protein CHU98_g12522 [Xylaria longipes]